MRVQTSIICPSNIMQMQTRRGFGEDGDGGSSGGDDGMGARRASSRVSGISDFTLAEGLLLDEDEDDLSDGIIASQMQFSDIGGSQESDVEKTLGSLEEPFGLDRSTLQDPFNFQESSLQLEGDRILSRRSSQRTPGADRFTRSEMLFQHENVTRPTSALLTSEPALSLESGQEGLMMNRSFQENGSFKDYSFKRPVSGHNERKHVEVSEEIKGLFQFIDRYKPRELEISTILKPFIPDFIPAVGGVDEFIKIPRPDGQTDFLGLKVLDERGPKQSDAAVVNLQLRASSMQSSLHPLQVASVENPEKNPKKLDNWINSIKELHRSKPPPSVAYSKPMPSIEKLMQEWPMEIEKVLTNLELPTEKLDLDIGTFADVCCSILDIPVYKSRVESLHVMFSLFLEFKNSMPFSEEWPSRP